MKEKSRKKEYVGIQKFIDSMSPDNVIHVPEDVVIEGGDIVVDKGYVFVGLSQRTNEAGIQFLKSQLEHTDFVIVEVPLKSVDEGEDCLHLDCVFVPVGTGHALVYSEGISRIPKELKDTYQWIEVNREEQKNLATNVLSLSPTRVISRDSSTRVNEALSQIGLEVILLNFDEAPKSGGSFRCCTLPLKRG